MRYILLFTLFCSTLSALPSVSDLFEEDSDLSAQLLAGNEITLFHQEEFVPQLVPESLFSGMLYQKTAELNPNMAIEGLYFLPREGEQLQEMLQVVNSLTAVSQLQGLEYYSASRGVMRLLFEESWRINSLEENQALPDLYFDEMPAEVQMDIHQKDLTFGDSESSLAIYPAENLVYMEQINRSPMRYNGIIRVIAPGNFQTRVLVIPCEEGLIYYGIMSADTLNIRAFKDRANNSFYNRMKALAGWFFDQLATKS